MTGSGSPFYDDPDAVASYLEHRHAPVASPNLVMEEPAVLDLIGPIARRRVLDLGCGDGTFATHCLNADCRSYLGVDAAEEMIQRARRRTTDERVQFAHATIEDVASGPVDIVAARLSLHYVVDLAGVFEQVLSALDEQGRFIFSVVHPIVTAAIPPPAEGPRKSVVVDDYFRSGPRTRRWFGRPVTWQHRTIEDYIRTLTEAGLKVTDLRECRPVRAAFDGDDAEFERRSRAPLFLAVRAEPA